MYKSRAPPLTFCVFAEMVPREVVTISPVTVNEDCVTSARWFNNEKSGKDAEQSGCKKKTVTDALNFKHS